MYLWKRLERCRYYELNNPVQIEVRLRFCIKKKTWKTIKTKINEIPIS